mgnify:CR=1 FL=1
MAILDRPACLFKASFNAVDVSVCLLSLSLSLSVCFGAPCCLLAGEWPSDVNLPLSPEKSLGNFGYLVNSST